MMGYIHLVIHGVNPVPWSTSRGPSNAKFKQRPTKSGVLVNYQEAIKEEVRRTHPNLVMWDEVPLRLRVRFWRQIEEYEKEGRRTIDNMADTTNLLKAFEDALQGVVYKNDRWVRWSEARIMAEGRGVEPLIEALIAPIQDGHD